MKFKECESCGETSWTISDCSRECECCGNKVYMGHDDSPNDQALFDMGAYTDEGGAQ